MVDKKNKLPLYLQLMEELIQKIEKKDYVENEKLPSEREFCEMYGLSRITVRNALQELERDDYIYKVHGKGTFVAPKSYKQNLVKIYSFTEEMKKLGKKPQTIVISFKVIALDQRIASKMKLSPESEVYQIIRLRLADGEPFIYETSYVPVIHFPGLTKEALEQKPMYSIFMEDYDKGVSRAVEQFSVTTLRPDEAELLQSKTNRPAMLLKRFAYNENDLIEYTISVISGNKFKYTVELT